MGGEQRKTRIHTCDQDGEKKIDNTRAHKTKMTKMKCATEYSERKRPAVVVRMLEQRKRTVKRKAICMHKQKRLD